MVLLVSTLSASTRINSVLGATNHYREIDRQTERERESEREREEAERERERERERGKRERAT